jgi:transcription termination factor NusB
MNKRKATYDRRRIIRRKEDRLIFKKEFNGIIENVAELKETLKKFREDGTNKEVAKSFEKVINKMENQIQSLDKKLFSLHSYWINNSE